MLCTAMIISRETRKMPVPMRVPTTMAELSSSPSARTRPSGASWSFAEVSLMSLAH